MLGSWEYTGLSKQRHSPQEPVSAISYDLPAALQGKVTRDGSIDVYLAVNELGRKVVRAQREQDSHLLRLGDES